MARVFLEKKMSNPEFLREKDLQLPPELSSLCGGYSNVRFFPDSSPVDEHINGNQIAACQLITGILEEEQGVMFGVFGPMGSGKSSVACLLSRELPSVAFFKHKLDVGRFGPGIQSQGGLNIEGAEIYSTLEELETQVRQTDARVLVVEEFQFSGETNEERSEIEELIERRRKEGKSVIFTGLDFDFRREPWSNIDNLIDLVDTSIVLAARCAECGGLAPFTMRQIDGQPAHFDDPVVMVGSVKDVYFPACPSCHKFRRR